MEMTETNGLSYFYVEVCRNRVRFNLSRYLLVLQNVSFRSRIKAAKLDCWSVNICILSVDTLFAFCVGFMDL